MYLLTVLLDFLLLNLLPSFVLLAKIMSTKTKSTSLSLFSFLFSLTMLPPFSTSLVKTKASISESVPAIPIGSHSSYISISILLVSLLTKTRTALFLVSKSWIKNAYSLCLSRESDVIPITTLVLARSNVCVRSSL